MIKKALLLFCAAASFFTVFFFGTHQARAVVLGCDLQNLVNNNSEVKIFNDCDIGDEIITISK